MVRIYGVFTSFSITELAGSLMHRAVLDTEGKYVMLWTPGEEDITFEIQVSGCAGLELTANCRQSNSWHIVFGFFMIRKLNPLLINLLLYDTGFQVPVI